MKPIDYTNIARAMTEYTAMGYRHANLPWCAPIEAIKATYAGPVTSCGREIMVGSAEQSFVAAALANTLEADTPYVACTPCWRDEVEGEFHTRAFLKVELFAFSHQNKYSEKFIDDAHKVFNILAPDANIEFPITDIGIDATMAGIEIGSFGERVIPQFMFSYGTGLAEPRFSTIWQKLSSL